MGFTTAAPRSRIAAAANVPQGAEENVQLERLRQHVMRFELLAQGVARKTACADDHHRDVAQEVRDAVQDREVVVDEQNLRSRVWRKLDWCSRCSGFGHNVVQTLGPAR